MARKSEIRPTQVRSDSKYTNPTSVNENAAVSFNFRHLREKDRKFLYKARQQKYFVKLLTRLMAVSGMSRTEMTVHNKQALRCHPILFTDSSTSENTFGLSEDVDDEAWQFQITSNEHGRVHGYFVGSVFYVVWLDPKHELYPGS